MIKKIIKLNQSLKQQNRFFASLDINGNIVSCYVFETKLDNSYSLVSSQKVASEGFQDGVIINIQKATKVIASVINLCEQELKQRITEVVVSAPYNKTKFFSYPYSNNFNKVIKESDIESIILLDNYKSLLSDDDFIVSLAYENIKLDNNIVENPLGLYAKNISANVNIITVFKPYIINLLKVLDYLSLNLAGIVYTPVAIANFSQHNSEQQLYLDIGYNNTILVEKNQNNTQTPKVINLGVEDIINNLLLNLKLENNLIFKNYLFKDYNNTINGKILEINQNGFNIKVSSTEIKQKLDAVIVDFFNNIFSKFSYKGDAVNIIMSCENLKFLTLNAIINNHSSSDNLLVKKIIESNIGNASNLEDIKGISIFNYYIKNLQEDSGLKNFKQNIINLN